VSAPPVPRVAALGGGHGLAASLRALREITEELTAIVTVADNGGSSGRLRIELDALPPGDLRMALTALAADSDWARTWAQVFQHRFGKGDLRGHAAGNLLMAALAEVTGSDVAGLALCGQLLGVRGRVLPMTTDRIDIVAHVAGLDLVDPEAVTLVRGQHEVATTPGRVCAVELVPAEPTACSDAVAAVLAADHVVLGPGSLFTSVLPHLLVPDLRRAIAKTPAQVVLCLNLVAQRGETSGFSPEAHLDALRAHVPDLRVDHVVADASVLDRDGLMATARELGATVHFAGVAADGQPGRHDPQLLAAAYRSVMTGHTANR
jgi:uncharacterized cofD-like protein